MLLWSLLVIFAPVDGKSDWLTLVAPSAVFEGDRIDLTCQKKSDRWKVKRVSYYKDGEELRFSSAVSNFSIQRAVLSDSGTYHCAVAPLWPIFPFQKEKTSRSVRIEVQELFPRPVLTVSPFRAIEGDPVTLTCETKLSPQRSDAQLRFCFFRDGRALGSGWSSSPELRVPAMWSRDSGSYWCQAQTVTPSVRKQSLQSQIHVRRVPVSNVSLEMRAPRGQVIEGRSLVLLCSVTEGTGNITFSWHREATGTSVGKKTQRSLSVELEVPAVQERDAGRYYCRADNGHGPIQSKVLSILVRIPVSCPILSITAPRAQAVEGDVVELRCEAQRGSPPILYRFYHEDVPLGNSSAPSGGGASFNLSLTAEHSGNYSCEADNGLGARRSEVVPLSLSGTSSYREEHATARALGLLGVPACVAAALLFYCRFHKTPGRHSVTKARRDVPSANSQASTPSSPSPAIEDLQPDYVNVDPGDGDVAYSFVWSIQLPEDSENTRRTILENKDPHVIYSGVKEM
ncbi:Fc receptor-like protein 2 isoform X1 [Leopardus geoffroyi]|uniref:Fc receptor-like protein 2 isoform X1 n=1 Tax=Leopardus geoffroyi TaxID=46844 RepID=UPI001E2656FC|nr:Fc receptor-like protein 2 isoform X1 [Leopardus geoffroyi]